MDIIKDARIALKFVVQCRLDTPLLLRSGQTGDVADSSIERTPDGRLHINGYVWASLLRRSMARIDGYKELVTQIGKNQAEFGVSPLWCNATVADLPHTAVTPGIAIDRKTGTAKLGALFNDELVIAGLPIKFSTIVFVANGAEAERWQTALTEALQIVNEGVENIGGGWTYGYGRLQVDNITTFRVDLTSQDERKFLWSDDNPDNATMQPVVEIPAKTQPFTSISVKAQVAPEQLLAIKSSTFPLNADHLGRLPDSFVFRRNRMDDDGKIVNQPVMTGKALRQAVFSSQLERKWRTAGEDICAPSEKKSCGCRRCRWFGSTSAAGVIAVTDATINNPDYEVLNRIQLCEHSMQNMNLFAGEYLTRGEFQFRIIIDESRPEETLGLLEDIELLLDEMKAENAPAGWHRVGGTTSCTGQIQVVDYTINRSSQQ